MEKNKASTEPMEHKNQYLRIQLENQKLLLIQMSYCSQNPSEIFNETTNSVFI